MPLQIESGFFHESDVKIVAKSIRDRVALIQWRRERIWPALQPKEQQDVGSPDKTRGPPVPLQVQVTYHAQTGQPGPPEPEEPEADQHLLPPTLPTSATSLACECSGMGWPWVPLPPSLQKPAIGQRKMKSSPFIGMLCEEGGQHSIPSEETWCSSELSSHSVGDCFSCRWLPGVLAGCLCPMTGLPSASTLGARACRELHKRATLRVVGPADPSTGMCRA